MEELVNEAEANQRNNKKIGDRLEAISINNKSNRLLEGQYWKHNNQLA